MPLLPSLPASDRTFSGRSRRGPCSTTRAWAYLLDHVHRRLHGSGRRLLVRHLRQCPGGPERVLLPDSLLQPVSGRPVRDAVRHARRVRAASARNLQTVTVAISDWACQRGSWTDGSCVTTPGTTFSVPITFNVYQVGASNAVGALIATKTQTFAIPYRPSADPNCPAGGQAQAGAMFKDAAGDCQNGFVSEINFAFAGRARSRTTSSSGSRTPPRGDAGSLNVMLYPSDADSPVATRPRSGRSRSRATCMPTTRPARSPVPAQSSAASAASSPPSGSPLPTSSRPHHEPVQGRSAGARLRCPGTCPVHCTYQ